MKLPSGGLPPTQVKIITSITKSQNNFLYIGLKVADLTFQVSSQGNKNNIKIALIIAITPPNLSGIALKIA